MSITQGESEGEMNYDIHLCDNAKKELCFNDKEFEESQCEKYDKSIF